MNVDLIPLMLAYLWPIAETLDRCPIRTALWFTGLARAELDKEVLAAAMRLLDAVPTRERC